MREYIYTYIFELNGKKYYVDASSKSVATKIYLTENDLEELPEGIKITRTNG